MRAVTSMLIVLSLLLGASLCPAQALATTAEREEQCRMSEMMAGLTMKMRQDGYSMESMLAELDRIKDDLGTDGAAALRAQVHEAFRGPRFSDAEKRRAAVTTFSDTARKRCQMQP